MSITEAVSNLIVTMVKDWKVKENYNHEEMVKDQKLVRLIVRLLLAGSIGTALIYTICKLHYANISPKTDIANIRHLLVSSTYLLEFQASPIYETIWLCQFLACIIMAMVYGCCEGFFIVLIFHVSTQLNILKLDVRNLVSQSKKQNFSSALKQIVDRHFQLKR